MTNNESPAAPSAMPALADALLANDDVDILDALAALKPLLTEAAFTELATLCDMCPMHMQDLDSCRDDDVLADTLSDLSTPADTSGYDVPLTTCRHLR